MHVQVITFNLKGIGEEEYLKVAESVAPVFADLPGLVSKHWLADAETNIYTGSEVFAGMASNPHFENVTARDFGVLEGPTGVTGGLATV
jgi:hypothetical protein